MTQLDVKATAEHASVKARFLHQLPFVTDREMQEILTAEVASTLHELDAVNGASGICSQCGGRCCDDMRCAAYAPEFGGCPIFDYRPFLCRFSYCFRFGSDKKEAAMALTNIALDIVSVCKADASVSQAFELNAGMYGACRADGKPLPDIVSGMLHLVQSARSGNTTWQLAREELVDLVASYRQRARHVPVQ